MKITLKERLEKAASLVGFDSFDHTASAIIPRRCGKRIYVSDVGCDHAYLSLSLVLSGVADGAIASDVREGPLEAAKANISRYGCEGKIDTLLTDGLVGVEKYDPTDIVICGMGGETIMTILNEAPFVKTVDRRVILQPMTGVAELAIYLQMNGFRVYAERYALDDQKPYRIFGAVYDGISRDISLTDALIGQPTFDEDLDAYLAFCSKTAAGIAKKAKGIRSSGKDASELDALYADMMQRVSDMESNRK